MVRLQRGVGNHFNLKSYIAILIEKIPRDDNLEYDWLVMTDGRFISLGRQIEQSAELIDEAG
ncbi:MAG: hypothetical protein CMB52_05465 [Euryarchaeota archaeon]|nr:hypothetical protein [Euryarchaeota archaeon]MBJ84945.1 hypothetical protein [Euryarchaeota archaeon]